MLRIVIVDDTARVRAALREMLAQVNNTRVVAEYKNVTDAIAGIAQDMPDLVLLDLVLLDLKMQTGSGLQVLRAVKRQQPAPVVFVFTNYAQREYRDLATQAGADGFFDKQADTQKLLDAVTKLAADSSSA